MRARAVLSRFLSLLDVTLILLGLFMVALAYAQVAAPPPKPGPIRDISDIAAVEFRYVYAGWRGDQRGKCFLMYPESNRWRLDRELDSSNASAIADAFGSNGKEEGAGSNRFVFLLFDDAGWFSDWPSQKLDAIETSWGVKIVPIYNAKVEVE